MKRAVFVAALIAVVGALVVAWQFDEPESDEAIPLPETKEGAAPLFDFADLHDPAQRVRLADALELGKPVVVNVWASWCGPCRDEIPAFREVAEAVGDEVTFLGVDRRDGREGAIRRLEELGGSPYPSGWDPDEKIVTSYGLYGMPSTIFISADGRILETHAGPLTKRSLATRLERHFGVTV